MRFMCGAFLIVFLLNVSFGNDRCPLISEIRLKQLNGWTVLNSNDDEFPGIYWENQFLEHVIKFSSAYWMDGVAFSGQCYYEFDSNIPILDMHLGKNIDIEPQGVSWKWKMKAFVKFCVNTESNCVF